MKRTIITVCAAVLALALSAGAAFLVRELTTAPSGKVVREDIAFDKDAVNSIDVDIDIGFVTVYKSANGVFEVGLSEPKKGLYSAAEEEGTLRITEAETTWLDRVGRSESDKYGIEIGVPEGASVALSVSGEVSDVSIDGTSVSGDAVISVGTGSITLNGITADGRICTDITTGGVELGLIECGALSAKVGTGDVYIRSVSAEEAISVSVTTGKVSGYVAGTRADYTVKAEINTGVSDLKSGGSGKKELTVSVGTGSIALAFGQ